MSGGDMFILQSGHSTESGKHLVGLFTTYDKAVQIIRTKNGTGNIYTEYTISELEPDKDRTKFVEIWRLHMGEFYKFTTKHNWIKQFGEQDWQLD